MKDRAPLVVALLAALFVLLHVPSGVGMLKDSDTAVLLRTIAEKDAPFSWFFSDWPLYNRFYRPVPTLLFELDLRLYGANGAGYAWTNGILAALAVAGLYWFVRELTERRWLAAGSAGLFALWQTDRSGSLTGPLQMAVIAAAIVGTVLSLARGDWPWRALLGWLVGGFLVAEAGGLMPLAARTLGWLPGRTAMAMTALALPALAAYCRYERLSAIRRTPPAPGPLDPPATRGTALPPDPRPALGWGLLSLAFVALSLASYEQAVMLPALIVGSAVVLRIRGFRTRWGWSVAAWGLLVGYFLLRKAVIPPGVSGYQAQQYRSGPAVFLSITDYVAPPLGGTITFLRTIDSGWLLLMTAGPWALVLAWLRFGAAIRALGRDWLFPALGWSFSTLAFLPMAWLKHFEHYHQWPMAFRAILVAALVPIWARTALSGCSRRSRPAPPRSDPAPGSLPRP